MPYIAISVMVLLIVICRMGTSAFTEKAKLYKVADPMPQFSLSLPMEVDELSNTVENPPGGKSGDEDQHHNQKRNGNLIPDNSCCPSVIEVIEPIGGKNRSGDLVELYQGDRVPQRLYEVSCAPSIVDKPCRYLNRRHQAHSKCVQQYSYTYALVRDFGVDYDDSVNGGGWRLDYIQVRSGCSCKVRHHHRHKKPSQSQNGI